MPSSRHQLRGNRINSLAIMHPCPLCDGHLLCPSLRFTRGCIYIHKVLVLQPGKQEPRHKNALTTQCSMRQMDSREPTRSMAGNLVRVQPCTVVVQLTFCIFSVLICSVSSSTFSSDSTSLACSVGSPVWPTPQQYYRRRSCHSLHVDACVCCGCSRPCGRGCCGPTGCHTHPLLLAVAALRRAVVLPHAVGGRFGELCLLPLLAVVLMQHCRQRALQLDAGHIAHGVADPAKPLDYTCREGGAAHMTAVAWRCACSAGAG